MFDSHLKAPTRPRRYPAPQHPDASDERRRSGFGDIVVRHPGYHDDNVLLALPSVDLSRGIRYGVDRALVHTACAILACNRFDGWLCEWEYGEVGKRVDENEPILPAGDYYYYVPDNYHERFLEKLPKGIEDGTGGPYPVCAGCTQYNTKTAVIPKSWRNLTNVRSPGKQDWREAKGSAQFNVCRVTNQSVCVKKRSILPAADSSWYVSMPLINWNNEYSRGIHAGLHLLTEDACNNLGLRADVAELWDQNKFVAVPKSFDGGRSYTLVVHCLEEDPELIELYHDTEFQELEFARTELLFHRFAMAILARVPDLMRSLCHGTAVLGMLEPRASAPRAFQYSLDPFTNEANIVWENWRSGSQSSSDDGSEHDADEVRAIGAGSYCSSEAQTRSPDETYHSDNDPRSRMIGDSGTYFMGADGQIHLTFKGWETQALPETPVQLAIMPVAPGGGVPAQRGGGRGGRGRRGWRKGRRGGGGRGERGGGAVQSGDAGPNAPSGNGGQGAQKRQRLS